MKFLVWCPAEGETREDASTHAAADAQDAAIAWAQEYDAGEYSLLEGSSADCLVAPEDGSAEPVRYRCTGEVEPSYWAEEVPPDAL
jgi:hypothetical protein